MLLVSSGWRLRRVRRAPRIMEGVIQDIVRVVGRRLKVSFVSMTADEAVKNFGWFALFIVDHE